MYITILFLSKYPHISSINEISRNLSLKIFSVVLKKIHTFQKFWAMRKKVCIVKNIDPWVWQSEMSSRAEQCLVVQSDEKTEDISMTLPVTLPLLISLISSVSLVTIGLHDICGNKLVGSCPDKISLKVIGGDSSCAQKVPWNVLVELVTGPKVKAAGNRNIFMISFFFSSPDLTSCKTIQAHPIKDWILLLHFTILLVLH